MNISSYLTGQPTPMPSNLLIRSSDNKEGTENHTELNDDYLYSREVNENEQTEPDMDTQPEKGSGLLAHCGKETSFCDDHLYGGNSHLNKAIGGSDQN